MEDEVLKYLEEHDTILLSHVRQEIEMAKRKEYLKNHPFQVWQGSNGYWYTHVPDVRKGRVQIKRRKREDLDEAIIEYWKATEKNPSFDELFTAWNERRKALGKISESSYIRYKQFYKRHYTASFGRKRIKDTKPIEIIEFLEDELAMHQLSAKAFGGLRDVTRGILKTAKRNGLIEYSIVGIMEMLDVSDGDYYRRYKADRELVFNEAETKAMMETLRSKLDIKNAGLMLLFVSGMRIGELAALQHQDLNPFECTVSISKTETRVLNGSKSAITVKDTPKTMAGNREIVIPSQFQWLITWLWKASENREWVFVNQAGTRCTTNQFRKRLKQTCRTASVYAKSPHKIRATYDSILLDAGLDNKIVTDQMGHADIHVSENNYHRNRKGISQKREILSSIEEFSMTQSKVSAW